MRIRFFNTYEPVTRHYRDLVPHLVAQGHEVEIVVSRARYRPSRDSHEFLRSLEGVAVRWTPSMGLSPRNGFMVKGLLSVLFVLKSAVLGLFGRGVDLNVFLTQPPFIYALGPILKWTRGQHYICLLMDLQPHFFVGLNVIKDGGWLAQLLHGLSRGCLKRAKSNVVIGRCMRDELLASGVSPRGTRVIPNWANEESIVPVDHEDNAFRQSKPWRDDFVILYAGNIGIPQNFSDLLTAAARLRKTSGISFVFVGEGAKVDMVEERIVRENLQNVYLYPFQNDLHELSDILGAGDLHFVSLRAEHTGYAVPSKTYGILAAGRPILYQGSGDAEIARLVRDERIGATVPDGEVRRLEGAVRERAESPDLARNEEFRARQLAEGPYSKAESLRKYLDLFEGGR